MPHFLLRLAGDAKTTAFCSILNGTPSRRGRFQNYSCAYYTAPRIIFLYRNTVHYFWVLNRLSNEFPNGPCVIRQPAGHRRGLFQRRMNSAKVVVGKPERVGRLQVFPLLAVGIRQPRHAPHPHSHG